MDVARRLWNGYIYDWVLCAASDFCCMWQNLRIGLFSICLDDADFWIDCSDFSVQIRR